MSIAGVSIAGLIQVATFLFLVVATIGAAFSAKAYIDYKKQQGISTAENEAISDYKELLTARDLKIQALINNHNLDRAEWEKQKALMQKDIDTLKIQNQSLIDKAFNKDLLTKMEINLEKLTQTMTLFIPLVSKDGFITQAQINHREMMQELDEIHAVVVPGKDGAN